MYKTLAEECLDIENRYKNTTRWLKAPNGKKSNLTEREWVYVRTSTFKKRFGNWEISTPDFEKTFNDVIKRLDDEKVIKSNFLSFNIPVDVRTRRRLYQEITKSFRGTYENKETGKKIIFGGKSLDELRQHDYMNAEHIASLLYIPNFIINGKFLCSLVDGEGRSFMYLLSRFEYDKKEYLIRSTIRSQNGELYYDHKLSSYKKYKGNLESGIGVTTTALKTNSPSNYEDKRLLELLQGFSYAVDENGEPKALYFSEKRSCSFVFKDCSTNKLNKRYFLNIRKPLYLSIYKEVDLSNYDSIIIRTDSDTKYIVFFEEQIIYPL